MTWWQALLLVVGGFFAGGINAVAGGGSTLTVPLLVLAGVPGNAANGSNRIGIYGGAIQAGVGLVMLAALTRAGYDLITANHIKVLVNLVVTTVALPVFILNGQIRWIPALVLAAGFTAGGWFGAHFAVKGGEKWIRVAMVIATVILAGSLLGLY